MTAPCPGRTPPKPYTATGDERPIPGFIVCRAAGKRVFDSFRCVATRRLDPNVRCRVGPGWR